MFNLTCIDKYAILPCICNAYVAPLLNKKPLKPGLIIIIMFCTLSQNYEPCFEKQFSILKQFVRETETNGKHKQAGYTILSVIVIP